jgi:hypothetical protein
VLADELADGFSLKKSNVRQRLLSGSELIDSLREGRRERFKDPAFLAAEIASEVPRLGRDVQRVPFVQHLYLARVRTVKGELPFQTIIGLRRVIVGFEIVGVGEPLTHRHGKRHQVNIA